MDIHSIVRYGGSTAFSFEATETSQSAPLCTALLSVRSPGMEAFQMVLNLEVFRGLGRAAPGTTRKGIVGIKSQGPFIQPKPISYTRCRRKHPNACRPTHCVGQTMRPAECSPNNCSRRT